MSEFLRTLRNAWRSKTWTQRWATMNGYYRNDHFDQWPWWQRVLYRISGSPWP